MGPAGSRKRPNSYGAGETTAARPEADVEVLAGGRSFTAETVLSTTGVTALTTMIDPPQPDKVVAAAARLGNRAMILVHLVVDRPRCTPFDAHYLPAPETVMTRLSEPKNYRDEPDPADRTVLCAEIPCWSDDELVSFEPSELGAMVEDQLPAIGLPAVEAIEVVVRRLRSVYPVFERATVSTWSADLDRVVVLGRQGLAVPDNLHHVLDLGLSAPRLVTDTRRPTAAGGGPTSTGSPPMSSRTRNRTRATTSPKVPLGHFIRYT